MEEGRERKGEREREEEGEGEREEDGKRRGEKMKGRKKREGGTEKWEGKRMIIYSLAC